MYHIFSYLSNLIIFLSYKSHTCLVWTLGTAVKYKGRHRSHQPLSTQTLLDKSFLFAEAETRGFAVRWIWAWSLAVYHSFAFGRMTLDLSFSHQQNEDTHITVSWWNVVRWCRHWKVLGMVSKGGANMCLCPVSSVTFLPLSFHPCLGPVLLRWWPRAQEPLLRFVLGASVSTPLVLLAKARHGAKPRFTGWGNRPHLFRENSFKVLW